MTNVTHDSYVSVSVFLHSTKTDTERTEPVVIHESQTDS